MRRLGTRALVAAVLPTVVAALAAVPLTPTGSTPAAFGASNPAAAPCTDALVVGVPGAGEGDPGLTGTAALGPTLEPLADAVVAGAGSASRTVTVRVVHAPTAGPGVLRARGAARTPAEDVISRASWKTWREPVPALVRAAWSTLSEAVSTCPDQLVYLLGYSQGAEAVHRLVSQKADADLAGRTVAVVMVGDAARVAGSAAPVAGNPAASRRGHGVSAVWARRPLPAVPSSSWVAPVRYVCSRGDVVCDLSTTRFGIARETHRSYTSASMRTKLTSMGSWLGRRLAAWPKPAVGQALSGRVGLVMSRKLSVSISSGARSALRWSATTPLPPGLRLGARGVLTGSPTGPGTYDVGYTVKNTSDPSVSRPMPGHAVLTVQPELAAQTSAGGRHTCAVRSDGSLWCWGANFYGQLGQGNKLGSSVPLQIGHRTDWAEVSAGGMHTCAVRTNGTLWCWGLNYRGQLGSGGRSDATRPSKVGEERTWSSVSAGWVHTCATRADGSAWCWGNNSYGQLGDGTRTSRLRPTPVARGGRWTELQAGGWHTCGVRRNGKARCWGRNLTGEIGDGTLATRRYPTPVAGDLSWVQVLPSWTHTCGLLTSGSVRCWGGNEAGQLGSGDRENSSTPKALPGDPRWTQLSVGAGFTCATDADLALWCWGTGRYGELGDAATAFSPVRVPTDRPAAALDLGWLHGCVTPSTGAPRCWGDDETGQVGDGPGSAGGTGASVPVAFPRPSTIAGGDATVTTRGALEPAENAVVRPAEPAQPSKAAGTGGPFAFNLVTFNVLGSNHTSPRKDAGEFSPARVRSEWTIDYLHALNASIVGFQEIQRDQLSWFNQASGGEYDLWPGTSLGSQGVQTSVAWRSDTWKLREATSVEIPFITQKRLMPLLRLENIATGRSIWVMNVHNAPQGRQVQRTKAVNLEIRKLKKVLGADPVFLIGDFNERDRVFCEVTGRLGFVAPRGGSGDGGCQPPSGKVRVDWIFGSPDVSYSGYVEDRRPLVQRITDHAVLRARISVP